MEDLCSLLGARSPAYILKNTINARLRRLGYAKEEMTGHGFRSMASTLLNEQGFAPDVIELQLAHARTQQVRAAYNKAQRLTERRKMMQQWADYLDGRGPAKASIAKSAASNLVSRRLGQPRTRKPYRAGAAVRT